jgi:hypothetical protein
MKENELRIGNLVYFNGNLEKIDLDSFHGIATYDCFDSYNPIQLTIEWLIKFGFEHELNQYENHFVNPDNSWLIFEFDTDEKKWYCSNGRTIANLEYVHQLQNLYFALTGEELTIK